MSSNHTLRLLIGKTSSTSATVFDQSRESEEQLEIRAWQQGFGHEQRSLSDTRIFPRAIVYELRDCFQERVDHSTPEPLGTFQPLIIR